MAEDKKISSVPSGYRKAKEAKEAKEQPRAAKETKAKEEKAAPPSPFFPYEEEEKKPPVEEEKIEIPPAKGNGLSGKVALLALLVALASLALAYISFSALNSAKADIKEIATDLRSLRDTPATVPTTVSTTARISFQVPLKDAVSGGQIPFSAVIPITGTGKAMLPVYGVTDIRFNGTANVSQNLQIDPSRIPPSQMLSVEKDVPLTVSMQTSLRPGQAWPDQFNDIIRRLERISS